MYDRTTIQETSDGQIRVRFQKNLFKSETQQSRQKKTNKWLMGLSLKAVLHLLWTEAKLNLWFDSEKCDRRLGYINAVVKKVSSRIVQQEEILSRRLLMHAPIGSQQEKSNLDVVKNTINSGSKALLLAPLKKHPTGQPGKVFGKLPVIGNHGLHAIFVPRQIWAKVQVNFAFELKLWEQGLNVMALVRIAPLQTGDFAIAQAREIVLMAISDAWIPLHTTEDIHLEQALRNAGTSFIKPLRFDAPNEASLPDFLVAAGEDYQLIRHV